MYYNIINMIKYFKDSEKREAKILTKIEAM